MTIAAKSFDQNLIADEIIALLRDRDEKVSACPSEIARQLASADEWRAMMPAIRSALKELSDVGRVSVTRGAAVLNSADFSGGAIRFRRGEHFPSY